MGYFSKCFFFLNTIKFSQIIFYFKYKFWGVENLELIPCLFSVAIQSLLEISPSSKFKSKAKVQTVQKVQSLYLAIVLILNDF